MEFETRWLAKYFFPNPTFLQVYYEAIANAFDAMATNISVTITLDAKLGTKQAIGRSMNIIIQDDGVGLNDERYRRFSQVLEPKDEYHKGLGRLVYFHYFSRISVKSVFGNIKRECQLTPEWTGECVKTTADTTEKTGTNLHFKEFSGQRLRHADDVKPAKLKSRIIEQFMPYFHKRKRENRQFEIKIKLDSIGATEELFTNEETITLADIPDLEKETIAATPLGIATNIDIYYRVDHGPGRKNQSIISVCIDDRTVPYKLLGQNAIPVGQSVVFLFESSIFTGKSDSARQRLVLPDSIDRAALDRLLRNKVGAILSSVLPGINKRNDELRSEFENRYPHLIGLFQEDTVGLIDREQALEDAQRQFFLKQKEVLESAELSEEVFQKSIDLSSRTLTEYILYRQFVIQRLSKIKPEEHEKVAHNLIVPRFKKYSGDQLLEGIFNNNAWILDDRFMSFRTILSEERMDNIIEEITKRSPGKDGNKPDISMIFSADPLSEEKVDVVVIEIKRKEESDQHNLYASFQLAERATALAEFCPNINRMWYFGIMTINANFARTLKTMKWTPLFSRGEVWYYEMKVSTTDGREVNAPTTLLDYDALVQDATARNRTFLELLKNGFKDASTRQSSVNNTGSDKG